MLDPKTIIQTGTSLVQRTLTQHRRRRFAKNFSDNKTEKNFTRKVKQTVVCPTVRSENEEKNLAFQMYGQTVRK